MLDVLYFLILFIVIFSLLLTIRICVQKQKSKKMSNKELVRMICYMYDKKMTWRYLSMVITYLEDMGFKNHKDFAYNVDETKKTFVVVGYSEEIVTAIMVEAKLSAHIYCKSVIIE